MAVLSHLPRRAASSLAVVLGAMCTQRTPAADFLVDQSDQLQPQFYADQLSDAIPLKTMRGVWRLREFRNNGDRLTGMLTCTGSVENPNKGELFYESGDQSSTAKGVWLLKPNGFGRDLSGKGIIELNARWKLRRPDGAYVYSGRVRVPSFTGRRPDATIEGNVLKLEGKDGRSERKVGEFEADLQRLLTASDELAGRSTPVPVLTR
eukprot:5702758-Pleurochrysis_carterae.AAC.1